MGERVNCQINHTTTGRSFYTNEFPRSVFPLPPAAQRYAKAASTRRIARTVRLILAVSFPHGFPAEEIVDVSKL